VRRRWMKWLVPFCGFVVALWAILCFLPIGGLTLLMRASRSGDVRLARALLLIGTRPNQRSSETGKSALFFAAANGHANVARLLLAGGADPNLLDRLGRTPLCDAGQLSRIRPEVFQTLLERGADPNAGRWNALECLFGQGEILEKARLLLEAGVAVDGHTELGDPPIVEAARRGNDKLVTLLLSRGAKADARAPSRRTALMEAAARGCLDCVRALISAGADSKAVDASGATALQIATESSRNMGETSAQHQAIVDLLRGPANGAPR
jgi:ankyrin repeat protein